MTNWLEYMASNPLHEPKKPELQDFGISPEEYAIYAGSNRGGPSCLISLVALFVTLFGIVSVVLLVTGDMMAALGGAVIVSFFGWIVVGGVTLGIARLVEMAILSFKKSQLMKGPVASRIQLYEEAKADYHLSVAEAEKTRQESEKARLAAEKARQESERVRLAAERARRRRLADYWMSLGGNEFERELGSLFRELGYHIEFTPSSGDQGVDLILKRRGTTTIVQCKGHQSPVGPAVARELYGSFHHFGADRAILACTGGFTRGVKEFLRDKPIALLSASELAALGDIVSSGSVAEKKLEIERLTLPTEPKTQRRNDGVQDESLVGSAPVCPTPGCRKTMVLRNGYRGKFWGCSRFPKCRGTRDF